MTPLLQDVTSTTSASPAAVTNARPSTPVSTQLPKTPVVNKSPKVVVPPQPSHNLSTIKNSIARCKDAFEIISQVGEGAFGQVSMRRNTLVLLLYVYIVVNRSIKLVKSTLVKL